MLVHIHHRFKSNRTESVGALSMSLVVINNDNDVKGSDSRCDCSRTKDKKAFFASMHCTLLLYCRSKFSSFFDA